MLLVFISFINKTKQMTLVFEWLKTKLMKTNILFGFITKTKLMALVLDWLKTKQINECCKKDVRGPKVMSELSRTFWGML